MAYYGDIRLGDTIDMKFTTRAFATGVPTTLAGTPSVAAYIGNSTTEITAGITLSVDLDSRTGLNNVRVVATGGNGYATATNIDMVITAGTVGGTSVVGEVVCSFSIECRSALMPTTAALTLDVSAGGEAGLDWANIGSKTTVNALTNTSIITTQKVDVDTIKTNAVVNGGTITFPTNKTLASTDNITAATGVDITKILGTAISTPATAGILDVNVKNMNNVVGTAITAVKAIQGLTTLDTIVTVSGNVTGTVGSVVGAVGSVTGNVGGNVTGTVGSVVGAVGSVTGNVGGSVASVVGAVGSVTGNVGGSVASVVGAVGSVTGNVGGSVASVVGAVGSVTGAVGSVTGDVGGNVVGTVASVTAPVSISAGQILVKKNTQYSFFKFLMTDSTTHAPATGLTVTATRAIDNGAFGACANAVSELAFGWYKITLANTDLNGTDIALRFTAAAADDKNYKITTQT